GSAFAARAVRDCAAHGSARHWFLQIPESSLLSPCRLRLSSVLALPPFNLGAGILLLRRPQLRAPRSRIALLLLFSRRHRLLGQNLEYALAAALSQGVLH